MGIPWDGDGSTADAKSSNDVLLEWLTTPGNCARWQRASNRWPIAGGAAPRETTTQLYQEIVAALHAAGLTHRKAHGVHVRLCCLEKSFWDAVAWKRAREAAAVSNVYLTQGLDVQAELNQRCRFYDTLAPLMLATGQAGTAANGKQRAGKPRSSAGDAALRSNKRTLDVLLGWLAAPGNYARWRATANDADANACLLAEILHEMWSHGLYHWSASDVRTRIVELECTVRAAVAWCDSYGRAIVAAQGGMGSTDHGFQRISHCMTLLCPHFERIGPAMAPLVNGQYESTARSVADAIVPALTRSPPVAATSVPTQDEAPVPTSEDVAATREAEREEADCELRGDRDEEMKQADEEIHAVEVAVKEEQDEQEERGEEGGKRSVIVVGDVVENSPAVDDDDETETDDYELGEVAGVDEDEESEEERGRVNPTIYGVGLRERLCDRHGVVLAETTGHGEGVSPTTQGLPGEGTKVAHATITAVLTPVHHDPSAANDCYRGCVVMPALLRKEAPLFMASMDRSNTPSPKRRRRASHDVAVTPQLAQTRPAAPPRLEKEEQDEGDEAVSLPPQTISAEPEPNELQCVLEVGRARHEQRCHRLREESLELEVSRKQIQITKEKALARHELRLAGVPEHEIELAFPLP